MDEGFPVEVAVWPGQYDLDHFKAENLPRSHLLSPRSLHLFPGVQEGENDFSVALGPFGQDPMTL